MLRFRVDGVTFGVILVCVFWCLFFRRWEVILGSVIVVIALAFFRHRTHGNRYKKEIEKELTKHGYHSFRVNEIVVDGDEDHHTYNVFYQIPGEDETYARCLVNARSGKLKWMGFPPSSSGDANVESARPTSLATADKEDLLDQLQSSNPAIRLATVEGIVELKVVPAPVIGRLHEIAATDRQQTVRQAAQETLYSITGQRSIGTD